MNTSMGSTNWMQRLPISEGQTISEIVWGILFGLWLNFPVQEDKGADLSRIFKALRTSTRLH
jgi:hypothetical protein